MDQNPDSNYEENLKKGYLLVSRLEEMQYLYFNGRPEWITLQKNDLKLYLAWIYYGYPSNNNVITEKNDEDNTNAAEIFDLYENKIKTKILDLYKIIEEKYLNFLTCDVEVGLTMVHSICKEKCDSCHNFPKKDIHKWLLCRLKLSNNKFIFIDFLNSRRYESWDEYIDNNNLPKGYMFYPKSGFYDPSKTLYQTITPISKKSEQILKTADIASDISTLTSVIVLVSGFIFPIAAPIMLVSTTLSAIGSSYQVYRQINSLSDMYTHEINTTGIASLKRWTNLLIATIGIIAAPSHAFAAITSEVNSTVQSAGKALTIFRQSACITQCTLEVFNATLDFIDNGFKITLENALKLSLECFIVTGLLMPLSHAKDILKIMELSIVWAPIYKTIEQIPYYLGQYVWNSVFFFKKHFAMFVGQVTMFFAENLTVENLLLAWKTFRHVCDGYQKQTAQLNVDDLLRHVVEDMDLQERVKFVLRGQSMVKLLDHLRDCSPRKLIGRALIKYCVDHVLREAMKLSSNHDDCVAELAKCGETRAWKVDEEFCKCYGLDRCAMDEYLLWAIGQVNAATLMAEYKEHASRPENMFDDEMVVDKRDDNGMSTKGYSFVAPCGILDLKVCLQFAEKINPQPHKYLDHKLVQPKPDVSLLLGVSAYSVNIVFFGIDLINCVPKMNICFFEQKRDLGSAFIDNHKGFRELQAS